jgi:AraC-like DNA-binding protein
MQIQPSFWIKLRRFCAQHLENEGPLRSQIDGMIDRLSECPRSDQHQMMASLFATLGRLPNAVELGFLIGGRVPATAYGVLSLGILTAPSIGDALRFVAEVHRTVVPLIDLAYEETASEGRFTIGFRCPIDSEGEALVVAMCTATIAREISRRSGRAGTLARLELTPSSKGGEATYRKYLSLMPHMDGTSNSMIFRRAALDLPSAHADLDTFNSIMRACIDRAELHVGEAPLQERVRETIMSGIGAPPSQSRLAQLLHLTPRQLRVNLERERTSYQAIIRDCRTEYASALLRNPSLSLSQIADRLGYSELSSFSHAFYRWTGKSPSAFRLEMHAPVARAETRDLARSPRAVIDRLRSGEDHPVEQLR